MHSFVKFIRLPDSIEQIRRHLSGEALYDFLHLAEGRCAKWSVHENARPGDIIFFLLSSLNYQSCRGFKQES